MLTMRNWMFIKQFSELREHLLSWHKLQALGDFDRGAFENTPDEVVSVAVSIFTKGSAQGTSWAICPTPQSDRSRDSDRTQRKRAATLTQNGQCRFTPAALNVIPEWPLVYWWDSLLHDYSTLPLLKDLAETATAQSTGDNTRFRRQIWECYHSLERPNQFSLWHDYVSGASGAEWVEPQRTVLNWRFCGLEIKLRKSLQQDRDAFRLASEELFNRVGIAFPKIGHLFSGRVFRVPSIFGDAGPAIFGDDIASLLCRVNSTYARNVMSDLNPTVNFGIEDAQRIPIRAIQDSDEILQRVMKYFSVHESHREVSIEFRAPGRSSWRYSQEWAQAAVDRVEGESLPEYIEQLDPEPPTDHLSFGLGVALGRFSLDSQGILAPDSDQVEQALPNGILLLDGSLDESDGRDGLAAKAALLLNSAWANYGSTIAAKSDLRTWLRLRFFADVHKTMYENRPIHWPLSSRNKTFVAWINIHRWNENTLRSLLADHLLGNALPRIDGELEDLRKARAEGTKGSDARFLQVQKWKEELDEFIATVKECAEKGPPPTDDNCPKREVDARYDPNLDDGVMINSAALWPLLEPQWKDPKKWWKELAVASSKGNKDYDWSHLAMRYFPKRVDDKCHKDPSLGVAHGCFWKYHPAKAWAWELRLQNEIAPDFRIEEASYRGDGGDAEHRSAYLRDHAVEAIATIEKEALRSRKDTPGKIVQELTIIESGLWASEPEACWDMETRIIKKQEYGFRLIAPDEPEARAKLIERTPQKETGRRRMLEGKGGSDGYLDGWEEALKDS